MKVSLVKTTPQPLEIRQSTVRRQWMDDTYNKHAYRCLPVTEANVSGWEIVLPHDVVFQWDGGTSVPRVLEGGTVTRSINGHSYEQNIVQQSIVGMATFCLGWVFNTPPGVHTWLTGTPNYVVDGAIPLSASIPSDWWPDEVNMSWIITKEKTPITFPAGSGLAFFNFYEPSLIKETEFEVKNLWDNKELVASRQAYGDAKVKKLQEKPWSWMNGIRTGLDAEGNRIGPRHENHATLEVPREKS
ncbi:MAG: DUF6065 family protein [Bacteroidetes bacterium]|nr:DUF6065 family protein [Bacteroidota bacterium]